MRYGVPRQGSKNAIAPWIIDHLPPADTLVDLFAGGGAITHCALLSGKWSRFIMNDLDAKVINLFLDSAHGKYTLENTREWISRDEFQAKKKTDGYIAAVWSFGNNGTDYIYGKENEEYKHALHDFCFFADTSRLESLGVPAPPCPKDATIRERYDITRQFFKDYDKNRLVALQRLQSLGALQSLTAFTLDYQAVDIPHGAVVYCDIPYASTDCKSYRGFDHGRFYKWAVERDDIFISEYSMPAPFIPIAATQKTVTMDNLSNSKKATEYIFTTQATIDKYRGRFSTITAPRDEQLSLF